MKTYNFKTNIKGFIRIDDDDLSEEEILLQIRHCLMCVFENESNHEYFSIERYGKINIKEDKESNYVKPGRPDWLWSNF